LFATLREVEASHPDPTAEDVWRSFRAKRPGDRAYWSRWLRAQLGISLRKVMQWRKMRRAMEAAATSRHATSVAHAAGFADSAHLSRVCLRTLGVRPSDVQNDKTVQVLLLARD
jgi:AraC-like DNA-binding protein